MGHPDTPTGRSAPLAASPRTPPQSPPPTSPASPALPPTVTIGTLPSPLSLPPPDHSHLSQCSIVPPLFTTYNFTMVAFVHTPVPLRSSLTKYVARRRC